MTDPVDVVDDIPGDTPVGPPPVDAPAVTTEPPPVYDGPVNPYTPLPVDNRSAYPGSWV